MNICIRNAVERDLDAINAIYNEEIVTGTATLDEDPWTLEKRQTWFAELRDGGMPVLVAEIAGEVGGFAYLTSYRPKSGYRHTREDTIYLAKRVRGKGLGTPLLAGLVQRAQTSGVHLLVAVITADNEVSINLHRKLGFEHAGLKREAGYKFGRWHDVVEMVRRLEEGGK